MFKKSKEELRRIQDLRRSNASQPIKSKKVYSRKDKHNEKKGDHNDENNNN